MEVLARLEYLDAIENEDEDLMGSFVRDHPGSPEAARLAELLELKMLRESRNVEKLREFIASRPHSVFAGDARYLLAYLQSLEDDNVKSYLDLLARYYVPTYNYYSSPGMNGYIDLARTKNSTQQQIEDRASVHAELRKIIRKTDRVLYQYILQLDDENVVTRYKALRSINELDKTKLLAAIPELVDHLRDSDGVEIRRYGFGVKSPLSRDTPSSLAGQILGDIGPAALPLVLAHIAYSADLLSRYRSSSYVRSHLKVINMIGDRSAIPVLSALYSANLGAGGTASEAREIIRRIEEREGIASSGAWQPPARK